MCILDAEALDSDIQELKIGKAAVSFYQSEIDLYREAMTTIKRDGRDEFDLQMPREMYQGEIESFNDKDWDTIINKFIKR